MEEKLKEIFNGIAAIEKQIKDDESKGLNNEKLKGAYHYEQERKMCCRSRQGCRI